MADWVIFYEDGSNFSSEDGGPEDAPRQGVAIISQRDKDVGRVLHWGQDTYCWEAGRWIPHDRYACERYLDTERHPIRLIGYWIPNERFWAIYKEARTDPRLPVKSGRHRLE